VHGIDSSCSACIKRSGLPMDTAVLSIEKDGTGHIWDLKTRAVLNTFKEADARNAALLAGPGMPQNAYDFFLTASVARASIHIHCMTKVLLICHGTDVASVFLKCFFFFCRMHHCSNVRCLKT
jgi:hypothetical protein